MKKQTKQRIAALVIVVIFGMSSIAFVVGSLAGTPQQDEIKPLENFVVEGPVDQRVEDAYYKGGFTWMKFYYIDKNDLLYLSVDQFPELFQAPNNQKQLIVQKLESNESSAYIYSVNGQEELSQPTEEQLIESVCRVLSAPPPDCAFLNQTKTNNPTLSINTTGNNTQNNTA